MHVNSKFITFSTTLFIALAAVAETTRQFGSSGTGSSQAPITPRLDPNYKSQVIPPQNASDPAKFINPKCDDFIDQQGNYGERGQALIKEITGEGRATNHTAAFFGNGQDIEGLLDYCPNFPQMSDDEKLNLWIWTMTVISNYESGCNEAAGSPKPPNNPPYGETVGAFQTPRMEEGRGPEWRGPGCAEGQGYSTTDHQVPCAVQILGDSITGKYHKGKGTFVTEKGSHWEVIMECGPSNRGLQNQHYFQNFEPCGYRHDSSRKPDCSSKSSSGGRR